jgi:tetratricopeptide (TPR) repeat protein
LAQNHRILRSARALVRGNQASLFSDAIAQARKIKPGEPLYDQAQKDIDRWSEVIFDFALGRAQMGDYATAMTAAQLVPTDRPIAAVAKQAITYWQQQIAAHPHHVSHLEQAAALLRPNSAPSYADAIALLQTLTPEDPDYPEAQHLIEDWSSKILDIARAHAQEERYDQAIADAQWVPTTSRLAPEAQAFIKTWQTSQP